MAEVVTDYSFTDAKVHKVLLTKHEEFPELLFTRYKLECWGATGGTDNIGYDEGYYSAAGETRIFGKKGDYVCTYIEISHDTEVYISIGTPGMENNSGGWYNQKGSVRAGGPTSISLLGTEGDTTPDYSKMLIRAKGGNGGTYIIRSNPQKVYDSKFRVSTLPDRCFAPGKRTIDKTYFTTAKSSQVKHEGSTYKVWTSSKHKDYRTNVFWYTKTFEVTGLKCGSTSNIGRWMILNIFSVWANLDVSNNPKGQLTWTANRSVTMAIGLSSSRVTLQDGPDGGKSGTSGTINWYLEADMNYCIYVKLDSTEAVDITWSITPYGVGGHSHQPSSSGQGCGDIVTTYYWEYQYTLEDPRQCTYDNYVIPVNTYDTSVTSLATIPNGDKSGYVRITKCNPMYRVNNIKNDDYRNLLIGRPIIGKDYFEDIFPRDLAIMRKDKWSETLEYNMQIINGFTSDNFDYLGTYVTQSGGYDCLIDIDNSVEEFIETEPGIYEYQFPKEGIYLFECWGAAGGHSEHDDDNENSICGYGGYVAGICYINKNIEKATIYVGGQGTMTSPSVPHVDGGFNGGSGADRPYDLDAEVGSGGGATDIRIGGTSLNDRILVAGGGAGQGPLDQYKYGHTGGKSTNYIDSKLIEGYLLPACNIVPDYNPIKTFLDSSVMEAFTDDDLFEDCYNCNGTGTIMIQTYPIYSYSTSGNFTLTLQPGTYKLECWGAEGGGSRLSGNANSGLGGKGGYSTGTITLNETTTIYIYVGGRGGSATSGRASGGYNGGGSGYGSSSSEPGNGGGGASDIRINSTSLYARVIVAGGGGGGGEDAGDAYGHGGGETGIDGESGKSSSNGTQTYAGTNGSFGQGGSTNYGDGGGGGGGWYGGGTSSATTTGADTQGGGGGSGYVYTQQSASSYPSGCLLDSRYYLTNAYMISGADTFVSPTNSTETGHTGNGYVKITTISPAVDVPNTCPVCEGTKKHLDENKMNDILTAINNYYPDYSGYNKIVNSPSNCIATQTSAGILGGFGYANSVSQQSFKEFTINESIIKGYIDQACADIPSYTNLTSYIGSWTTELLSKYLINCSYCNGEGRYVTGYTYTWKTDLSSSKIYSGPSSGSRYCYYCTQSSCEWYGYYTFSSESNYDYYGKSGQLYYGTPGGHEKHGWYRRSEYDAYQVVSGTKYATCPTCNGTKQHYNPEQKDAIYNDIIEYIGNKLNEYDATMIPITSPAISTYPVYVKGPGAGGGWYGGGVLRDKKNFIAAGGGSNYVYSESSKSQYPGTKPDNFLLMVNTQSVSGLTYQPMINSYLNMRFGSTGDGAVRIRKLSTENVEPQLINLISNITETRDM